MRVYDYKPEGFKGSIKVQIPDYFQRNKNLKESGIDVGKDVALSNNIDAIDKLVRIAQKHIQEIDIEKGNIKIKSWDELIDSDENDLIQVLGFMMIRGGTLGEALGRSSKRK